MFRKALKNKRIVTALATVAVLALAGAAFAYWTTTGSGSGTGSVASSAGPLTLHGTVEGQLSPGGSSSVAYTADNANGSSELVGTVHAVVSIDSAHAEAGCKASDFSIEDVTENQVIPAGASGAALAHAGTITMADTAENQDACQGATISLALSS